MANIGFGQGTNCSNATLITLNGACASATINDTSENAPLIASSGCSGTFNREGWYRFTVASGPLDVIITATASNRNLFLQLISESASCSGLTEIACANANTNASSSQTETIVANLENGTYYVKVVNAGSNGSMTLNTLCVSSVTSPMTFSSNGTFTVPSGVNCVMVETWGGGGRGGSRTSNGYGGGGGGGAYSMGTVSVTPGASYNVYVGTGSTSTSAGGDSGFSAGTLAASLVLAKGGNSTGDNSTAAATGGAASSGVGMVRYSGGSGAAAGTNYTGGGGSSAGMYANGNNASGMTGGSAPVGGGVGANGHNTNNTDGNAGSVPGGGGSGARRSSGNRSGGVGGNGRVRITYFKNPTAYTAISTTSTSVCPSGTTTLTASGGISGTGASTLWFAGGCGSIILAQQWQHFPYTSYNTTINSVTNGILNVTSGLDPQINWANPAAFNSSDYKYVCARYRVVSGDAGQMEIYYGTAASPGLYETKKGFKALNSDGNWHTISIDMTVDRYTTGMVPGPTEIWEGNTINELRFDFTSNSGVTMEIDYLILANRPLLETSQANPHVLTISPTVDSEYFAVKLAESTCADLTSCVSSSMIYAGKVWTGAVDSNWTTAGNWTPSGMPTINHCVQASSGEIVVNGNGEARNIRLMGASELRIPSNYTLSVENEVDMSGTTGKFIIEDNGSLVQHSEAINSGEISVFRNAKPMRRYDYTYWSSPVGDQVLYDLSPLTLSDKFFSWNPSLSNWEGHYEGAVTMGIGAGYIVRAPQTFPINSPGSFIAEFSGVPNNGEIVISGFQGSATNEVWNLIGNPYPSAIDINRFLTDPDNSETGGTIYLWTHNTPNAGNGSGQYVYTSDDYATYNLSGAVATAAVVDPGDPADNGNAPVHGYIAAGQSFFVRGIKEFEDLEAGNNPIKVKFKNSMRMVGNNNNFFKPGPADPVENWQTTGKHRFWLNLSNNQGAFNQALVGYIENATDGLDRLYDGEVFGGNYVTLYSLLEQEKLTIQGKGLPFDVNDSIALGYKVTISGAFEISLDHFDGLFEGQSIYLKDNYLNLFHDLKESAYSFASAIGTFDDRFEIVYQQEQLGVENPSAGEGIVMYKNADSNLVVNAGKTPISSITVYDVMGRMVAKREKLNQAEVCIQDLPCFQVLIVEVLTVDGLKYINKFM